MDEIKEQHEEKGRMWGKVWEEEEEKKDEDEESRGQLSKMIGEEKMEGKERGGGIKG